MKLFYYITSLLICQVLFQVFSNFFEMFAAAFCAATFLLYHFSSNLSSTFFHFFPFSNLLFCDTSASTFLRQPSYYITSKQVCQYLFRNFFFRSRQLLFPESRQASFSSPYLRSRSTAFLLYHFFCDLSRKITVGIF